MGLQPAFKPGAATWNTDDPDQQPWLKNKKLKAGVKKDPEVAAAPAPVVPFPYMTSAKLTKSIHTTGASPSVSLSKLTRSACAQHRHSLPNVQSCVSDA